MIVGVTGSSGFIGSRVCRAMADAGDEVRALSRQTNRGRALDLADESIDWGGVFEGCDVVVNLAGKAHDILAGSHGDASEYWSVNAHGAARVAAGAARAGVGRFIQVSSIKVLGDSTSNGVRFRESDPPKPVGLYAESKAAGEALVRESLAETSTECAVLRLPLVMGPPYKGNLATLERAIRKGLPLPLGHPSIARRTYVRIADLEALMVRVAHAAGPLPSVLHATSAPDLTAGELARVIGREIGRRPRLVPVPAVVLKGAAAAVGRPEIAGKICDEMLVSGAATRAAVGA